MNVNERSVRQVNASAWVPPFRKPLYESYSFANIPRLVRWLLADAADAGLPEDVLDPVQERADTVVLLFIDGLGWRFVEEYRDALDQAGFVRDGTVSKITSQFPSTTAAHVTTIHTGLPVGQSGVYEWFYYEPQIDQVISPLLFSLADERGRNTLKPLGVSPRALFPRSPFYRDLRRAGVRSFVLNDEEYARSPYSETVCAGAEIVPCHTFPEALVRLGDLLREQRGKAYYFLYFSAVDGIAHRHGPESPFVAAEIEALFAVLERNFHQKLGGLLEQRRAVVLMTADHGQVRIDPETSVYLNRELPQLLPLMKTNRAGKVIAPCGSARDQFLHVREGHVEEVREMLAAHLRGRAEVRRVSEMIEEGFFGPGPPSPQFLSRVGDLVTLPLAGETVWWAVLEKFEQHFRGHHGGLTPDEMDTFLLSYRCG